MLFPSLLLFLGVTSAFADVGGDIETCANHFDVEELLNIGSVRTNEDLQKTCPMVLGFFECMQDILKRETGMSLKDLAESAAGTEIGRGAVVAVNVRDLFVELCTEGSPLNEDYLDDAECFDAIHTYVETCKDKADAAMEAAERFVENAQEIEDEDKYRPDNDCAEAAFMSACVAAMIHDSCGRRAFDTYNTVVKRSGVFKNILCSAEDLEHLRTTFVDKLELEDDQKDLLRLALDLKRRRK